MYIDEIFLLYIMKKREELNFTQDYPALCLVDNLKAHCMENTLRHIDAYNIYVTLISHTCTYRLQQLDISVKSLHKILFTTGIQDRYLKKIYGQFKGLQSKEPVDLRLAIVKPLGAQWLI